jgi:hypothetical protein
VLAVCVRASVEAHGVEVAVCAQEALVREEGQEKISGTYPRWGKGERVGMNARHKRPECPDVGAIEVVVVVGSRPSCLGWRVGKGVRKLREENGKWEEWEVGRFEFGLVAHFSRHKLSLRPPRSRMLFFSLSQF